MITIPYINPKTRELFNEHIEHLSGMADTPGELNYTITKLVHNYLNYIGPCYASINEVMGVLACVQAELYRVVAGPYENKKRALNGPVSELDDNSHERMT